MMKINQKLLSIAILGAILGLASCNNDDGDSKLSKTDAQSKIQQFNTSAVSDLQDLSNADGVTAVKDLFNLVNTDDPFAGRIGKDKNAIRKFFQAKGKDFKTIFVPRAIDGRTADDPFDYNSKKGVYEWDADNSVFNRTGDSEIIEIKFPTKDSQSNNATLKITAYTEKQFLDEDTQEYYYNPQVLKAELLVGDTKVASIDLDIEWADDILPSSVDLTLFVSPYTATVSFNGTSTSSTLTTSLKKSNDVLFATSVTVKYDSESKTSESVNSVSGYVQLKNVKVQGTIDVKGADNSTDADPNNFIHLKVYVDNSQAGVVVFVKETVDGNEEYVAYLQYNDGSKEKLEDVLKPVIDELNSLSDDFS